MRKQFTLKISTNLSVSSTFDRYISKGIILACFILIGISFVQDTKAQCPTGTAPYVSVNPPSAASSITTTSATISDAWSAWSGGFGVTVYIEYGTTSGGPYTSNIRYTQAAWNSATATVTPAGAGTYSPGNGALSTGGTFTANLTGLASSTTYYYRARIVGSGAAGTCTSTQQSFTTLNAGPFTITTTAASSVTATAASTGGNITLTGAVTVTQRGIAYGTATNPTTAGSTTNNGTGGGSFTSNLTGLTPSTTYYARAYAIGSNGITYYGPNQTFTTLAPFTITTTAASSITATTATTGGNITVNGGITITQRGVAYGTTTNPTTAGSITNNGTGTGAFTSNLTGLTSSTTYYVRAYVIGSNGVTYYGPNQTFTTAFQVSGIISPFSLSPAWFWGTRATYTFPSGSFPAVPPGPTIGTVATTTDAPETSTSVSFRNGNVAAYSNSMQIWNGSNSSLKNLVTDATCAGSSTGGGVSFPDPANNATNDAFYVLLGNDMTGGACAGNGVNQYRVSGTSSSMTASSTKLATPFETAAFAAEAITAGTDGDGGYWVVLHDRAATNKFRVWHYTASGISGPVEYEPATTATINTTISAGYLKFSPCMDKIAWAGFANNSISVYSFDRKTGAIGAQLAARNGVGTSGLEFSPDGTKIFYSGPGLPVSWFLISNPATGGSIAGSNSWTMQMGPDAQIYTSGIGSNPATWGTANVGVINDPNGAATYTNITLAGSALSYRGLSNIAWLSPQTPTLAATASNCDVTFQYTFLNYFNDNVTTNNIEWSWDNGTTWVAGTNPQTHTFPNGATYNVRVRFKDAYCSQEWTQAITGGTSCTLPVEWLNLSATESGTNIIVNWTTATEKNNSHFIVERSTDGINFTAIGQVKGSGNSTTAQQYQFIDTNPNNGANYYRIIQYDTDGSLSYSDIVVATINHNLLVNIAPNPSQDDFHLKIYSNEKDINISVTNILGQEVFSKTISDDLTNIQFGEYFAKGTYILRVIAGQEVYTQKIIKQ